MSPAKAVRRDALKLPLRARAVLARELLTSLDDPADHDVEAAWLAEVRRREREVELGAVSLEEWEVVRERIAKRLRALRG